MIFECDVLLECIRSIFKDFGLFGQEGVLLNIGIYSSLAIMAMDVQAFFSLKRVDYGARIEAELERRRVMKSKELLKVRTII